MAVFVRIATIRSDKNVKFVGITTLLRQMLSCATARSRKSQRWEQVTAKLPHKIEITPTKRKYGY